MTGHDGRHGTLPRSSDAVRLLGGQDGKIVLRIPITGFLMSMAARATQRVIWLSTRGNRSAIRWPLGSTPSSAGGRRTRRPPLTLRRSCWCTRRTRTTSGAPGSSPRLPSREDDTCLDFGGLVPARPATDRDRDPEVAAEAREVVVSMGRRAARLRDHGRGAALLALDDAVDSRLAAVLERALQLDSGEAVEAVTGAEAIARLFGLGLLLPANVRAVWPELRAELITQVAGPRPDPAARLERIDAE